MMVLGSVAAFATEPDSDAGAGLDTGTEVSTSTGKTITLSGGKAGHTYTLYQIFTGDVETPTADHPANTVLTNIQWGTDAPAAYKAQHDTAAAAAEAAEGGDARAWAQALGLTGNGSKQVTLSADGNVVFDSLAEGYYVILDTNNNENPVEGDYSSAIIVAVVDDVTGNIKGSATTSEKKVADNNDTESIQTDLSNLQNTDWQDSADYDIGDYVPFKLTATLADNISSYAKYHVTFQDKQGPGLATPTEWTVTVLGKTFTLNATTQTETETTDKGTKITVAKDTADTDYAFAITVTLEQNDPTIVNEEITSYLNAESNNQAVVVTYQSQLTGADVVIGKDGNPNEMYVKYSNNPEDKTGGEEGKTKTDKVIVFTYKTVVDKIDETGAALDGATFVLYKEVATGTEGAETGTNIKKDWNTAIKTAAAALADAKSYVAVTANVTGEKNNRFTFKGIDDGTYVLVETAVPAGYNPWTAQQFVVAAEHDADSEDPKLTKLTGAGLFAPDTLDANAGWVGTVEITKKDTTKYTTSEDEMFGEIENNSGATLPETGGIGTTIFYIAGSIMVLAAAILLITKRRMGSND